MQGINDLVTPFLAVFLSPHMEGSVSNETATDFPEEVRLVLKSHATGFCMVCCSFGGLPPHTSKSDRCVCCKRSALLHQEYIMLLLHFARKSPVPCATSTGRVHAQ